MITDKIDKFLIDTLGISSGELIVVPSTHIREIIADKQNRSVEVIDNNGSCISIAEIERDNNCF